MPVHHSDVPRPGVQPEFPLLTRPFSEKRACPVFFLKTPSNLRGKGSEGKQGTDEWHPEHKIIMTSKY